MRNMPAFTRCRWDALPPVTLAMLNGRTADISYQPTFNWPIAMVLGAMMTALIAHVIFRNPQQNFGAPVFAMLFGAALPLAWLLWRNWQRARIATRLGFYFLDDAVLWRDSARMGWQIPYASVQRIALAVRALGATPTRHHGYLTLLANDGESIIVDNEYDVDALFTALSKHCKSAETWRDAIFCQPQEQTHNQAQALTNPLPAPTSDGLLVANEMANEMANEKVNEKVNEKANEKVNEKANEKVNEKANEKVNKKANETVGANEREKEQENQKANVITNARQPKLTCADFSFNDEASARNCFEALLKSADIDCFSRGYSRLDEHLVEISFALRLPVADFLALQPYITFYQVLGFKNPQAELQIWLDANPQGCITLGGASLDWTWFSVAA